MKKTLKIILSVLVLLMIVAFFFVRYIGHSGLPDYDKSVQLKGLKEEVKVYRDELGVPHVIAKNEDDLYKVTGYILAQDRIWQMDLVRRLTQGRLSEIFGEKALGNDELFRALNISEKSKKVLETTDKNVLKALEAFADGVNQYIEEDDLPFEFKVLGYKPEKWKAEHSVNFIGYMAWTLNLAWNSEISALEIKKHVSNEVFNELMVDLNYQKDVVFPEFGNDFIIANNLLDEYEKIKNIVPEVFSGSNNWVVAGKKSTTGKPIFANDMHLGFNIPGVWSQIHQKIEGKLDVTGVILPGQPFVVSGHNDKIAWGITNVGADTMDFYIETINKNTTQYKFNGEWRNFIIKHEKFILKSGDTIKKTIRHTHRGPVVSGIKNTQNVISTHWTGNDPSDETLSLYIFNRAKNWEDFRKGCSTFRAVSQNIAYADVDGNIGIQNSSGILKRTVDGNNVFPGDTDKYDWNEMYAFEELPYKYNPENGYVHSANNRTTTIDSFYVSSFFALPNRANRIKQMLTAKEKLSIEDFKNIHTDQHSVMVDDMKPIIINALKNQKLSELESKALVKLENWNNILSKDSSEALVFEVFYENLKEDLVKDELGEDLYKKYIFSKYVIDKVFKDGKSILCDDVTTKDVVEDLDVIILKSYKKTIQFLSDKYGNNIESWRWGDLHKLVLKHPLGQMKVLDILFGLNRTFDAGGSFHTVNPFAYIKDYTAIHGASQRHIYSTADWNKSQSIIPTGVSGIPSSKHYCDQSEMFMNGVYHDDYIGLEEIKKTSIYTAVFSPKD